MEKVQLHNDIFLYENFLDSQELQALLDICYSSSEEDWPETYVEYAERLDKESKYYKDYVDFKNTWTKTTLYPKDLTVFESIKDKVGNIIDTNLTITEDIHRIKRLTDGRSIGVHYDNVSDFSLKSGLIIYLNDDFDGGEIFYPEINFSYKPKANSLIIHPATEKYKHGVSKVIGNTRYSLAFFLSVLNQEQRNLLLLKQ